MLLPGQADFAEILAAEISEGKAGASLTYCLQFIVSDETKAKQNPVLARLQKTGCFIQVYPGLGFFGVLVQG